MRQGAWQADHHRHNNFYHDHHAKVPYEQCSTKYRNQCKKVPQQKCVTLKDLKCTDVWVEVLIYYLLSSLLFFSSLFVEVSKTDLKIIIISLSIIFEKIIIMVFYHYLFPQVPKTRNKKSCSWGGRKHQDKFCYRRWNIQNIRIPCKFAACTK